jgi:hypothetical protein
VRRVQRAVETARHRPRRNIPEEEETETYEPAAFRVIQRWLLDLLRLATERSISNYTHDPEPGAQFRASVAPIDVLAQHITKG